MGDAEHKYTSFSQFYPDYLQQHQNRTSRRLHFTGTLLVILLTLYSIISGNWLLLLALPVAGYSFAWAGHYFFEKNRPATFQHPIYSLVGDFVMFRDILTGRIRYCSSGPQVTQYIINQNSGEDNE